MAENYRLAIIKAGTFCILMFGLSALSAVQAAQCVVKSGGNTNCIFESSIRIDSCNGASLARHVRHDKGHEMTAHKLGTNDANEWPGLFCK